MHVDRGSILQCRLDDRSFTVAATGYVRCEVKRWPETWGVQMMEWTGGIDTAEIDKFQLWRFSDFVYKMFVFTSYNSPNMWDKLSYHVVS